VSTQEILMLGCAAAVAMWLWRMLNPTPTLQIDECGIVDRRTGLGRIRWDDIEGAYRPTGGDRDTLLLQLRDSDRLPKRIRRTADSGHVEVRLDLSDTPLSPVEILQRIVSRDRKDPIRNGV
jgi:hypothetical protein